MHGEVDSGVGLEDGAGLVPWLRRSGCGTFGRPVELVVLSWCLVERCGGWSSWRMPSELSSVEDTAGGAPVVVELVVVERCSCPAGPRTGPGEPGDVQPVHRLVELSPVTSGTAVRWGSNRTR